MDNPTNLRDSKAIEKIKELATAIDICLFCTNITIDQGETTRPMSTQNVDDEGNLWFFSDKNSGKNKEIENDSTVRLYYSHPSKSSYMVLNGTAEIQFDKNKVSEIWSPMVNAWFPDGKEDSNISLIKVTPKNAYYWDIEGNQMINFFKMIASAATGKMLIDATEGSLNL